MADQNRNPGSKQADGSDDESDKSDKAKMGKESMGGSGGRTGSGVGRAANSDKTADGASDLSAGSKNKSEEAEEG